MWVNTTALQVNQHRGFYNIIQVLLLFNWSRTCCHIQRMCQASMCVYTQLVIIHTS